MMTREMPKVATNERPVAYARGSERAARVEEVRRSTRPWLWAAISFLVGAAGAASFLLFVWKPPIPPLGLTVSAKGQQLLIAWNPAAVSKTEVATLEVKEPGSSRLLRMKGQQLTRGAYPLGYTSGDFAFRMTTYRRDGSILSQESAHFLGYPAGAGAGLSTETPTASQETERLRTENMKLTARVQQLQERVKVLDTILSAERAIRNSSQP